MSKRIHANMIWARTFLEAQGFFLKKNILQQDNQSAIKIVTNGKRSSRQKTKHMDNRYFLIKDRLESEGIKVRYFPTGVMLADFFTKPLQGILFRKFRAVVLGYKHIDSLVIEAEETPQQERVSRIVLVLVHHPLVASKCLGPMLFDPGETPTSKFTRKR